MNTIQQLEANFIEKVIHNTVNNSFSTMTIRQLREQRNISQAELGKIIGVGQSSFAYKEKEGTFSYEEQQKLAKYLKIEMQSISWNKQLFPDQPGDKDRIILEQKQTIIRLEEKVKTLEQMIERLLEKR